MLKIGLFLLITSGSGFVGRCLMELPCMATSFIRLVCVCGLSAALTCLIAAYVQVEYGYVLKRINQTPHMVKSVVWKLNSMA